MTQRPVCASLAGERVAISHNSWIARNSSKNGASEGASHAQFLYNSFSFAFLGRLGTKADPQRLVTGSFLLLMQTSTYFSSSKSTPVIRGKK